MTPTDSDSSTPASAARSVPVTPPPAAAGERHTYGQILKSSVLIGGSSAFNVVIGVVRTKAMAVLLGPAGFGLMGLYTSITNLAQTIAGMGVNSSGVRQIAAAVGSGDAECVARTATVLRRASVALGVLGGVLLVALSRPVSRLTFGSDEHAFAVALLALAVFFRAVSDGQGALIQGLRRISDLAGIAVLGGLSGTLASIAIVYFFRERGIAPSLIAIAGATLVFSWWFSRRAGFKAPSLSASQVGQEVGALLALGFAFLASGMFAMGAAYAVRIMIVRQVSVQAAGLYQAAWIIGGLYVGFILQAMGADFYPRLTAAVRDRAECNRLVNEQAQVSLLLAGPGIIATLTFAPLVIALLYSPAFADAVEILRWICLGATLQVITWPMGFIIVAEGRRGVFFWCELTYTVAYLGVAWALVTRWGLAGAGMAFFISYVVHGLIVYPIVRWLTGFRWSRANRSTGVAFLALTGLVFGGFYILPLGLATVLGALAAVLNAAYSARVLARLVSTDRVPARVQRWLTWLRVLPPGASH